MLSLLQPLMDRVLTVPLRSAQHGNVGGGSLTFAKRFSYDVRSRQSNGL